MVGIQEATIESSTRYSRTIDKELLLPGLLYHIQPHQNPVEGVVTKGCVVPRCVVASQSGGGKDKVKVIDKVKKKHKEKTYKYGVVLQM
jgi:hypothetical protein